ncbi:MAG: hypothetical protein DRP13_03515 [Candidatus Aenigmatarchaeota archaeon]|nr:MAG: hypothetical protein DRP18_00055 [Candidatus Aenigmarchaeota archaeon]RLJ07357.1 MAG: hypothetical protein DRP16_03620 [Candidatus Aenigmarchaeota archaeon]RLJ07666.1 MAG: hypothetical protein DRP13_03515 [Candidatus Aenigmarchaeota archaeon]
MDVIVKTISRILFPFILLVGAFIAFHGHLTPGGAFPAGAVIATGFALLVLVFREPDVEHKLTVSELIDLKSVSGIFLMILILSVGSLFRKELTELQTPLKLWSGGFTLFSNVTGMFMVITAIVLILYSLVRE